MPKGSITYSFEYHCREVARWSHMPYTQFCRLPAEEQSAIIAHYEVSHQIEYLMQKDAQRRK